jgi:hypothetical protein
MDKAELQLRDSPYYVDSVIDARNQGGCVGFTLKGMDYRQTAAYFEQPFDETLHDLFLKSLPENENKVPLILRINKFLLSQYLISEMYYSIMEINITFIVKKDGKYYELYQGMASSETSGFNGAGPAFAIIAGTLSKCYNDFLLSAGNNPVSPHEIQANQLSENPIYTQKYRIENVGVPARGIYHTFSDFINYEIDTTMYIKVEYFPETEKVSEFANIVLAGDNTWVGNIWGFSDGKNNYINNSGHYYPIYRKDSSFRFKVFREGTRMGNLSPYIAGAILGGIVGALTGFAVIPMAPDPVKDAIVECQIELNSGLIIPVNFVEYKKMNSRMILYMSKYQKEENEMEIYVDGEFICELKRNAYHLLIIPPDRQKVELCLKSQQQETCELLKPILYDAGVYICEVKNNQPPSKDEAKAEIRKSILAKIYSGEITKTCLE